MTRPSRRTVFILAGAIVVVGLAVALVRLVPQRRPQGIRTAAVARGDVSVSVSATGAVTATSQVDVRSRATGTVTQVLVEEGNRVTQGQLLATINDPDARAALRESQAQVNQFRANVADAQAKLDQARQTLPLTRGQSAASIAQARATVANTKAKLETVKTGPRPEQIAQAKHAVEQAKANVTLAKTTLDRNQQLFTQGFIPRSTLDQSQNQYDVNLAQLHSAEQNLNLLRAGALPSDIAAAEAEVRLAEGQLANAQAGALAVNVQRANVEAAVAAVSQAQAQLANAQAAFQNAQERYNEGWVRAPISGIVAKRSIEVGQTVIGGTATNGNSVFTLANVSPLLANVSVDETDIAKIRVGMPVQIRVDALPDASFSGVVERIAPAGVVSQNVNQYTVTVRIEGSTPALRLGMTVDAEFVVAEARRALVVPNEAVRGQHRDLILLVGAREQLTPQRIVAGISNGRVTEIKSGLQEGQTVYLGPVRAPSQAGQQPRNPFQPNFQRRPTGGAGGGR
jgi:HlyD family secretion protein